MTEAEAWLLIQRLTDELATLNFEDDWEALVLQVPQEEHDEAGNHTDEWHVEVGWHCWGRNSKTGIPSEYGLHLAVSNADTTAEFVYGLLERNKAHTLGQVRTFRTYEAAKRAVFN